MCRSATSIMFVMLMYLRTNQCSPVLTSTALRCARALVRL
jgi:hypothetical protein